MTTTHAPHLRRTGAPDVRFIIRSLEGRSRDEVLAALVDWRHRYGPIPAALTAAAAATLGVSPAAVRRRVARLAPVERSTEAYVVDAALVARWRDEFAGNCRATHAALVAEGHPAGGWSYVTFWRRLRDAVPARHGEGGSAGR